MTLDGSRVRRYLEQRKKSKEWLADQLNCSLRTVENILAGKAPRVETLAALAKIMGCRIDDFLTTPEELSA